MALDKVAVVAMPFGNPFELAVACEAFGLDRSEQGVPNCEFGVVTVDGLGVPTGVPGMTITTDKRLDWAADADLVIVPAGPVGVRPAEVLLDLLRDTVARGARVMSICSGSFVLGAAGLLDGRPCTTHWMYAVRLAREFPTARVNPNVLYVVDGPVLTSAGTVAGLDLALRVIRDEYGETVANIVARRMVMPPHRDGGQAQFVDVPLNVRGDSLAPLLDEVSGELAVEHTVETLATRAGMSERTFARRFRAETGTTPHAWLTHQRVLHARRMLEAGDDPIEAVARRSGFGTAAMLRHHFTRIVGTSPHAYRRTFRG